MLRYIFPGIHHKNLFLLNGFTLFAILIYLRDLVRFWYVLHFLLLVEIMKNLLFLLYDIGQCFDKIIDQYI